MVQLAGNSFEMETHFKDLCSILKSLKFNAHFRGKLQAVQPTFLDGHGWDFPGQFLEKLAHYKIFKSLQNPIQKTLPPVNQ